MIESFKVLWKDICDHYGYKNAANTRILTLYSNAAEKIPENKSNALLSAVIGECERFPSLPRFKDICDRFIPQTDEFDLMDEHCPYCLSSGLIKYTRKDPGVGYDPEFFASCPACERGRRNYHKPCTYSYDELFGAEGMKKLLMHNTHGRYKTEEEAKRMFYANVGKIGKSMPSAAETDVNTSRNRVLDNLSGMPERGNAV